VSPKSLNRRECTPRKKRMQEIFYVGDQNFALNDTFGKSDSFERPRNPLYFFRIDSTSYAGVQMTTCVVSRAKESNERVCHASNILE
jgi:hypothetical protein